MPLLSLAKNGCGTQRYYYHQENIPSFTVLLDYPILKRNAGILRIHTSIMGLSYILKLRVNPSIKIKFDLNPKCVCLTELGLSRLLKISGLCSRGLTDFTRTFRPKLRWASLAVVI